MRLFVLLSRFPYPLEKGDKLRAFHQLRILSKHHEVFLCALHEIELEQVWIDEVKKYCAELKTIRISRMNQLANLTSAVFSNEPLQVAYFYQSSAQKQVNKCIKDWKPDAIYCQLIRTAKYVQNVADIPKVIDFQDAFSKGIERRLETDPWYWKPILHSELKRLNRYEQTVFNLFNHCTIISEQDRNQLPFKQRNDVTIVRNGVELEDFKPSFEAKTVDVLFAGNMGYQPNVEAAVFLEKEVMPLVRAQIPNAKLMLAGARPDQKVKELASELTEVTGWVNDIRDCYAKAKVFVAPMMIGTGLQNKLLEAMAMCIPCVTSTLANNALKAKPEIEILIGESPQEYAQHILDLLNNAAKAERIATAGHQMVTDHFSWKGATKPLLDLLKESVQ
ncbi:MAG: glycosyltransferase [Flavobacteriales bacterium]|nr:glycosyltransferase [Flavobacteriales bacterium]